MALTMIPREEGVEEGGLEGQGGQGGPSIVLDSAKRVYLRAFLREVSDGDPTKKNPVTKKVFLR